MTMGSDPVRVFLLAGEPSGEALAAKLMKGLSDKSTRQIEFIGVGGPLMAEQGLESLFPMEELSVMGLFEVLPKLPGLLRRISETADSVKQLKPDIFISIDAPDFSFRVAKKLQGIDIIKVHYVAPSVWAWRPGRAQKIAGLYDHLLTLLPFEPPYFEKVGLPATFVGHSVVETGAVGGDGPRFREQHGLSSDDKLLMMLPGSRRGEVSRHLPIFKKAIEQLQTEIGKISIAVPVIGRSAEIVRSELSNWPLRSIIVEGEEAKYDAMASANVALAASGTVGLELALARLPHVIAYKMNPLTGWLARRIVKLDYVNLVNIMLETEVVPELLIEKCTPDNLAVSLGGLFHSEEKQQAQIEQFDRAMLMLGQNGEDPGVRAADVILDLIKRKDRK
jgi:lipid-A-disaccharide synthase